MPSPSIQVWSRVARRWRSRRAIPSSPLDGPDLGGKDPLELIGCGPGGRAGQPLRPVHQARAQGGFELAQGPSDHIEVGAGDGASGQGVTQGGHGGGGTGAFQDPAGVAQRGAGSVGDGLFGEGGHWGELGGELYVASVEPGSHPGHRSDRRGQLDPLAAVGGDGGDGVDQLVHVRYPHANNCTEGVIQRSSRGPWPRADVAAPPAA